MLSDELDSFDYDVANLDARVIQSLDFETREMLLDKYISILISSESTHIKTSWKLIELFGINILISVLNGSNHDTEPFGKTGISNIYTITFRLGIFADSNTSREIYMTCLTDVLQYVSIFCLIC